MKMNQRQAWGVLLALLAILLFGTQMPGAWRDEAFRVTQLPWEMTKVAHFLAFLALAWVARSAPLRWPVWVIGVCALLLGLGTEGLQFFASAREPSLKDVVIDLAGAMAGMALAKR